ncbi:MAG: ArsR/SmtB family transcription factor [Geminicoccaceae bacterium]
MTEPQAAFRALADPSRRAILMHLSERDMSIGDVAEHFSMTRAAIKKHLTVLEEGRLISVHTQGRERINRLEPAGLKPIAGWIAYFEQFWDERLKSLENAIDTHEEERDD